MDSPSILGFTPGDEPGGSGIECSDIQARIRDGSRDKQFMCSALSPQQMQLVVCHSLDCTDCADYLNRHGSDELTEMLNKARADAGQYNPVDVLAPESY